MRSTSFFSTSCSDDPMFEIKGTTNASFAPMDSENEKCEHEWKRLLGGSHLWRCQRCEVLGYDKVKTIIGRVRRAKPEEVRAYPCSMIGCGKDAVTKVGRSNYCRAHEKRARQS